MRLGDTGTGLPASSLIGQYDTLKNLADSASVAATLALTRTASHSTN